MEKSVREKKTQILQKILQSTPSLHGTNMKQ